MKLQQAVFVSSAPGVDKMPVHNLPEFAFIGRSNVGKSSLINMLCQNFKLAHTSATPGKTQLINHFCVDNRWMIVDLPGYGFAKVPKTVRAGLEKMITGYICKAPQLVLLFVLIDCRHPLQKIDLDFLLKLGQWGIPFSLIFTKTDKISATALSLQKQAFTEALAAYWEEVPPIFATSSQTGAGREEVLDYVGSILAATV